MVTIVTTSNEITNLKSLSSIIFLCLILALTSIAATNEKASTQITANIYLLLKSDFASHEIKSMIFFGRVEKLNMERDTSLPTLFVLEPVACSIAHGILTSNSTTDKATVEPNSNPSLKFFFKNLYKQ